jgi:hypothetical protein
MPIIANNTNQTDEKGVMVINVPSSGLGSALSVWECEEAGYGYTHEWGSIERATVFDAEKVKTLDDIERIYGVDITSHNQRNSARIVAVVKTITRQVVVYS